MSRAAGVLVNGTDLGTQFGFVLERPAEWASAPVQQWAAGRLYGLDYQTVLAGDPLVEPREITLEGTVIGTSPADLVTKLDGLKRFVANGTLQLVTNHDTARYHDVRLVRAPVVVFTPAFVASAARVTIALIAHDPCALATSQTTVNFTATAQACALGSAISRPLLTITGPATNPLLTLADASGATRETLGFTLSLGSGDTLVIDTQRKTARKTISSVAANAMGDITTNTARTFLALDPRDGDQLAGTWPSLKVSSGTGAAVYRKRYR